MRPHTYGGKIWYKMDAEDEWQSDSSDTITANTLMMNGAEYSGTQLGTPDFNIYLKGCAYAYADVGSGDDQRILISYMHNPNIHSYSISFSAHGVGISYNSPSTICTAAKLFTLSYYFGGEMKPYNVQTVSASDNELAIDETLEHFISDRDNSYMEWVIMIVLLFGALILFTYIKRKKRSNNSE